MVEGGQVRLGGEGDTEEWMILGWVGVWRGVCGSCIINEKLFTNQIQFHQNSRDSLMGRWMDGRKRDLTIEVVSGRGKQDLLQQRWFLMA